MFKINKISAFVWTLFYLPVFVFGENCIQNGNFDGDKPLDSYNAVGADAWNFFLADNKVFSSGKNSLHCLPYTGQKEISFRSAEFPLDAEKKYKFTISFKTENLEPSKLTGCVLINNGWGRDIRLRAPAGTNDWKEYSVEILPPPSNNGKYTLVICPPVKGDLWIDNIRLEKME